MSQTSVTVPVPRVEALESLRPSLRSGPGGDDLHRSPPITLQTVRGWLPWLAPLALTVFALLAVAASVRSGAVLVWDRPITEAFVSLRSPSVDRFALWMSRLGSTPVVLAVGALGVALAARRCRTVALVMLAVVATRPALEWLVKDLVARPRPVGDRMVPGTGFSYPSGHVLAAAATWGFVPVIAGLYIRRRWLWWTLSGLAGAVIVLVAWSRVWLSVHWTSDVVGSAALAFVALSVAELAIDRRHGRPGQAGVGVGVVGQGPSDLAQASQAGKAGGTGETGDIGDIGDTGGLMSGGTGRIVARLTRPCSRAGTAGS